MNRRKTLQHLATLYDAWGKPEQAAAWRDTLAAYRDTVAAASGVEGS